jgi:hypothetical protein
MVTNNQKSIFLDYILLALNIIIILATGATISRMMLECMSFNVTRLLVYLDAKY